MAEKTWIKIKRGLVLDPKHRIKMGESRWLYDFMLDKTDWDSGTILEWVDKYAADEMQMPLATLRKHRYRLEEEGYISCIQKKHNQTITIHNWTNPREYSGEVYNEKKKGNQLRKPSKKTKGNRKGNTKVIGDVVTSTSNPQITDHNNNTPEPQYIEAGKEFEALEKKPKKKKVNTPQQNMVGAISMVTGYDLALKNNRGLIGNMASQLRAGDYTPEQVVAVYSPGGAWYKIDFRGKKGQKPTPGQMPQTIKNLLEKPQSIQEKSLRQLEEMYPDGKFAIDN